MKITTNYNKQDWKRGIIFILFVGALVFIPFGLWVEFALFPALGEFLIFMEYVEEEKFLENYVNWLLDNGYLLEGEISTAELTYLLLFLLGTLGGAVYLTCIVGMTLFFITIGTIFKLAKKLKLNPTIKLVIFKNGKQWKL